MQQPSRRQALAVGMASVGSLAWGQPSADSTIQEYSFHYDHIIGTSLDGWVRVSNPDDAERAEQAILAEIERLNRIFSTHNPGSELSQLNRTTMPMVVSADLIAVLRTYEHWVGRSNGGCCAQLQAFVQTWQDAEQVQREPEPRMLAELLAQISRTPWQIDGHTVTRLTSLPLNLNAVAKGYIIQRAADAAFMSVPDIASLVLNIGGDMVVRGSAAIVGVQDPQQPAEQTKPLTLVRLMNQAMATSGGYQRFYTISERRYSHLLDPRNGRPATALLSATIIAPDSVTANTLATTAAIGTVDEALRLVANTPHSECLLVAADGREYRSAGFARMELESTSTPDDPPTDKDVFCEAKADAWPEGYQVAVAIELPTPAGRAKRPYVAVWFENADGKPVRTVEVWGNSPRWIRDLSVWWKFAKDDAALVKAVSRATRKPGKYEVVWDGKDDQGKPVPQGTYTIKVEVHREHGKHLTQSGRIQCGTDGAKVTLEKNAETGDTLVEYRKKK